MPWYGMHLIERVRHQAAETERAERAPERSDPPTRSALIVEAIPTLFVVAVWGMAAAALYCAVNGISEWDIIMTIACAPLAMVAVGLAWGSQKSQLSSGLDAAIVTGAVVGVLFFIALLW